MRYKYSLRGQKDEKYVCGMNPQNIRFCQLFAEHVYASCKYKTKNVLNIVTICREIKLI